MEEIKLNTAELEEKAASLRAGQRVLLSGTVYTSRDAAHKRITELLDRGEQPPYELKGAAVSYTPRFLDLGLKCMIGKGKRSGEVIEAMKRNEAVYLCAIGGAGALAANCIEKAEVIAFSDLGCESVKRLTLKDFPLIVAIDSTGKSIVL